MLLRLHPRGPAGRVRPLTLTVTPGACHSGCLRLSGTLSGTISPVAGHHPDTGSGYTLKLSGKLSPLGRSHAGGSVAGTGFTARGHETLRLTIAGGQGTLTLQGRSPQVPGFTSP